MKSPMVENGIDHKTESDEGPASFQRAITLAGHGKFNYLLLLAVLPAAMANVYISSSMSYVLPSAKCDLKLEMLDNGLLNSMSFAGMISTAFLWGFIVDTFGRRSIMVWGFICTALCMLASSLSQVSWLLVLFQFVDGIVISGPYAALMSYLAEIHSDDARSRVYMWLGVFFSLGNISLPLLAWLIIPNKWQWDLFNGWLKFSSWRLYVAVSTIPGLTAGIAMYFFPESPRFLISQKRHDEALEVFKRIYAINTGKDPETYPVKFLADEESTKTTGTTFKHRMRGTWNQIVPLFKQPHVVSLVVIACIQFGATVGSNSLKLWMPMLFSMIETYDKLHENSTISATMCEKLSESIHVNKTEGVHYTCTEHVVNSTVYINSIVIALTSVLCYTIAGAVINAVGKRKLMVFCFLGGGLCCGVLYWAENSNGILGISSVFVALSSIGGATVNNIIVDTFPTYLRTMALSATMMCGRIGAVVGNLLFPPLFSIGCLGPFIMIGAACLTCSTLVFVIPRRKDSEG